LSIDNQPVATGAFKTQTEYKAKFDFSGGRVIKVSYKIVNDAHVNVERAIAAKMARD
jgi:arylsulfatase